MKATDLLHAVRQAGGEVQLAPLDAIRHRDVPKNFLKELTDERYLVAALLKEERANAAYENAHHDPRWWIDYDAKQSGSVVSVGLMCTCRSFRYPHAPEIHAAELRNAHDWRPWQERQRT